MVKIDSEDKTYSQLNYYRNNKDYYKWNRIKRRYGLTKEDYEELLKEQKYSCGICKRHISELSSTIHVDHCHETNVVRGLLCMTCNSGIGYFKDDPDLLQEAINYIKKGY